VVLVCAPTLVADSLKAMDHRALPNSTALAELMGRNAPAWDRLQAEARYDGVRTALSGPDFPVA
jgi:beta-N-acetylhexosaminidase